MEEKFAGLPEISWDPLRPAGRPHS